MNINVYMYNESQTNNEILRKILTIVKDIKEGFKYMSTAMDTLVEKVTAMETVQEGVILLLTTLKSELDAALANSDIPAIQVLSDRVGVLTQKLAEAAAINTPAA